MVKKLIDVLRRGDDNGVDKLIYSLNDSGQAHVARTYLRPPRKADSWGETGKTFQAVFSVDMHCQPH